MTLSSATSKETSSHREGRNRSQSGYSRRGEAALTPPRGGAAQADEADVRRVRGRALDGAPRPAGQPAGSPALPSKARSPRLLWGSPWEGAGALSQLRPRRGRAGKKPSKSTPAGEERRGKRGREDREDSITHLPTSSQALPPGSESPALPGSSAPAAPRGEGCDAASTAPLAAAAPRTAPAPSGRADRRFSTGDSGTSAQRAAAAPWGAAPRRAPRLWSEGDPAPTCTCKLLSLPAAAGLCLFHSQLAFQLL